MPSSSSAPSASCVAKPQHSRSRVRNVTLSRAAAGRGHGSMRRRSVTLTPAKHATYRSAVLTTRRPAVAGDRPRATGLDRRLTAG